MLELHHRRDSADHWRLFRRLNLGIAHHTPCSIREGRPQDRQAVLALVPRLREFGPVAFRAPEVLDAGEARTLTEFFDSPVGEDRLWVADSQEHLLGAAYATVLSDYFTRERHGHLGIFMVAQDAEGAGVAAALLAHVERWARHSGFRFLTLNVFAGNERARAFYERHEFKPDYVRYLKGV